jgi:nitrite reductase (NO-forming)
LYGHSQGGWVVLEVAAADPSVAFVVTSSGPGVTMADQERYATGAHLAVLEAPDEEVAAALETGRYVKHPLTAKPGELVRFWFVDAGPSLDTDFHIVRSEVSLEPSAAPMTLKLNPGLAHRPFELRLHSPRD